MEFRKSLCITAGLITLVEAGIWGAVSIYSIGIYQCSWNFFNDNTGVSTWSMLDITYLMGGCGGSEAARQLGYSFTPPSGAATSLQIWVWANTVLSLIWIPTCILLIVAVLTEVRGKNGALLYYPWEVLTVVLIIFDFAGTVYHVADIFQTSTPDKYAKFTFETSWDSLTLQSSSEGITTWLPSLFVSLFFCRFVVIWILNIFFVCAVFKASTAVAAYKTKHLQSTLYNAEGNKSWRDMFHNDSDQVAFPNQAQSGPSNILNEADENQLRNPDVTKEQIKQTRSDLSARQELSQTNHKTKELGVPFAELNTQVHKSSASYLNKQHSPQSPYQQRRNVGYISRPGTPDSFNEHWKDIPPPIASEIKLPPELNRVRPFSYTAGDQPQLIKGSTNISRSNSRLEQPPIPRPDYSLTDRRAASLEYIPNRFKVPSPKRPIQIQNSFDYNQHSPNQLKNAPITYKNPHIHPRTTLPDDGGTGQVPRPNYIPSQGQVVYSRQISQNKNYNINKLY